MILFCRLLPWHKWTWTGRKSPTGHTWEARCSCGRLYAVYLAVGAIQWATMTSAEFEANIGWAPSPSRPGEGRE